MGTPVAAGLDRWSDEGLCKAHPEPDLWFPARRDNDDARRARAWCGVCPVRMQCLNEAMALEETGVENTGIWGGLDEVDRNDLRRKA